MSDAPNASGANAEVTPGSNQGENEFVPKRAFEEVSRDMHRYKQSAKEAQAAKSEYEAKLKSLEEEKLREANQYKELYEREKQEREVAEKKSKEKEESYLTAVKKSALKGELGGRIKDAYLAHANVKAIELNEDGTINQESLLKVANEFRKNHGELIPQSASAEPTANASPTGQTVGDTEEKDLSKMSQAEIRALLAKAAAPQKT